MARFKDNLVFFQWFHTVGWATGMASISLSLSLSLSLTVLTAIFPGEPGLASFVGADDDGGGGDNWSYKTSKLQSNRHYQQTNIQLFTGRMPFMSPNQQRQSTEGKISHITSK